MRCEHAVVLDLDPDFYTDFASLASMNPVSIAWELIPYSFVIDWVIDIGGYLRSLESALIYSRFFKSGYTTETTRRMVNAYYQGSERIGNNIYTLTGNGFSKGSKKRRAVLSALPFPHLPVVNCDLGWRRVASAGALAWQASRRN